MAEISFDEVLEVEILCHRLYQKQHFLFVGELDKNWHYLGPGGRRALPSRKVLET